MLKQHLFLVLGWSVFCILHSVLADHSLKKKLSLHAPRLFTYYRLFYTLFAFATLAAIVAFQLRLPSPPVFPGNTLTAVAGWIIAAAGGVVMFICIKKYFLSLSGIKSLVANAVVANNLRIDGIHRFVRHPLYLGTFLAIWGAWIVLPIWSLLLSNAVITVYTLIGMVLEEQKLVMEFGQDYVDYKKRVPSLLPHFKGSRVHRRIFRSSLKKRTGFTPKGPPLSVGRFGAFIERSFYPLEILSIFAPQGT